MRFILFLWGYTALTWIVNLVKLLNCDFEAPFKEEFIHGISVVIVPATWVTAWL